MAPRTGTSHDMYRDVVGLREWSDQSLQDGAEPKWVMDLSQAPSSRSDAAPIAGPADNAGGDGLVGVHGATSGSTSRMISVPSFGHVRPLGLPRRPARRSPSYGRHPYAPCEAGPTSPPGQLPTSASAAPAARMELSSRPCRACPSGTRAARALVLAVLLSVHGKRSPCVSGG